MISQIALKINPKIAKYMLIKPNGLPEAKSISITCKFMTIHSFCPGHILQQQVAQTQYSFLE
jgi:hypothetical protein